MMVAKIGDSVVGICTCAYPPYPDVGTIVAGSSQYFDTGPGVARMGDVVSFSCGVSNIVSSSMKSFNIGPGVARMGDSVTGCGNGTIIATSNTLMM